MSLLQACKPETRSLVLKENILLPWEWPVALGLGEALLFSSVIYANFLIILIVYVINEKNICNYIYEYIYSH